MTLTTHIHTSFDAIAPAEWNRLAQQAPTGALFLTHEWQLTNWNAFQRGALQIVSLHRDADLIGIAPLTMLDAGAVEFSCYKEVADYLDFIFANGAERECTTALFDQLATSAPDWHTMTLYNVPEDSRALVALNAESQSRGWHISQEIEDVCPIIPLPATFDAYLAKLDSRERRELQRKLRRADEDARITHTTSRDALSTDVADFIRLMKASTYDKSGFMTAEMERYFYTLAQVMFDAGWLDLSFLEVEGEHAASYMNFVFNQQTLVYNSGLDPAKFAYLSPGQVLIAKLIQRAIEQKHTAFDFLQGNEEYKYKLGGVDKKVLKVVVTRD